MQLQFLGAAGTVTGSRTLLTHRGRALLVDCGLFQGYKLLRQRNWAPLPVSSAAVGAVVLTHAHIDHSGYLPVLVRDGFRGKVWCTPATAALLRILLPDSAHLQEEEAAFANRHGFSRHRPALPLYTQADAERALRLLHPVDFGQTFRPLPGLTARLTPAGHLVGAACARLQSTAGSVLFSGDLGRPDDLLMRPPEVPEPADLLVLESTYGDRVHPQTDPLEELAVIVRRTAARGGVLLVPAFAVGRSQALLHALDRLRRADRIPTLPVYLDSPMALAATRVYAEHAAGQRLGPRALAALPRLATMVETVQASKAVSASRGPMIVIAASGMATGGRVLHHLKAFAGDRRNTILLVGHQVPGTRGAALAAGAASLRIHGQDWPVRARVARLQGLSGHADAAQIVDWLRRWPQPPRQVLLNHGEPGACDALRQRIERELGWPARAVDMLERADLDTAAV